MVDVKKILLADDDPNDVELILHAFKKHQIQDDIQVVADGNEALNYLYRRPPYADFGPGNPVLILLDMKMPKVDGLQVLKKIKAEAALKMIPVVLLSSSQLESDVANAYACGANAYVIKPVEYSAFVHVISVLWQFWGGINTPPPIPN